MAPKYLLTTLLSILLSFPSQAVIEAKKIITGLDMPVFLTAPADSRDYLYILEKKGIIRVYDRRLNKLMPQPFLDISSQIKIKMNEQGLLGMAFSPNYKTDHCFYLYYTDLKGNTQISRFKNQDDTITEEKILHFKQLARNHNGGWIEFGPDGLLYIGTGDGGRANDPNNNAQDPTSLLGKILCIDVSGQVSYKTIPRKKSSYHNKLPANTKPEVFAIGLRNPWRCCWDGDDLYIADVGQNAYEEINIIQRHLLRGANFGWRFREGLHPNKKYPNKQPKLGRLIEPFFEYGRDKGYCIIGGYVYRGSIPSLQGCYFFADYVTPHIWSLVCTPHDTSPVSDLTDWSKRLTDNGKPIRHVSSFGKDPQGEHYIISHDGNVFKIVENNQ